VDVGVLTDGSNGLMTSVGSGVVTVVGSGVFTVQVVVTKFAALVELTGCWDGSPLNFVPRTTLFRLVPLRTDD